MKTIEEAKFDYVDEVDLTIDIIEQNMNAFDAGVEFAQRWIPISEEPIPFNESILVKVDNESIYHVTKILDNELWPWLGDGKFKIIESIVTHWRPIELK